MWVSRVIAIRNDGERTRGGRGKRGKCQPSGLSGEAGNAPSLLARKGERNPLQGFRATIERTVSNPSANSIVATPHCRACSLEPLRLPEALIFLRFRVFRFWRNCRFFPVCNSVGCSGVVRHRFPLQKIRFRDFPLFSANFRF